MALDTQLMKMQRKLKDTAEKYLKSQLTFHTAAARAHHTSAGDFEKESSEHILHSALSAAHTQAGEECSACLSECTKTIMADDLGKAEMMDDQIVPSQISAVAPEPGAGRMVLRTGQVDHSAANKTQQPAGSFDFSKLHAIEE